LTEADRLQGIELSLIRQVMRDAPPEATNLALGELGFPLPDILRQQAIKLLEQGTPVYTPNAGLPELREAISCRYSGVSPERICVCNGVEEAVFVTLLSILNPGDKVAIPDPDYTAYTAICNILEANVIRLLYESDLSSVDWDIWTELLAKDVKVLILSHPSNPCGHVFSADEAGRLAELCRRHGIILVVDEIYAQLFFDRQPVSFLGMLPSLFILGGLSKSHCMSGWRLGWVVSPIELSASVIKARQYVSTCSNWLSQRLAVFALSTEGEKARDEIMGQLRTCRSIAIEQFSPYPGQAFFPAAGPYMMLKVDGDDLTVCRMLAAKGVVCVPGSAFGDVARGWLRLNYAVDPILLASALKTVCHELYLH
jgi:aspartate/methionine/tyrosine aminotransferase